MKFRGICWGAIALLLAGNVFLAVRVIQVDRELQEALIMADARQADQAAIAFIQLFTETVLTAKEEIGVEARLALETRVRAIGSADVLEAWKRFIESDSEAQAKETMVQLLQEVVKTMSI